MKYTAQILWKVIAKQFYLRNSGFFLLIFVALFGVTPQGPIAMHVQLMRSILSSGTGLFAGLALWFLYNLKCASFVLTNLAAEENSCLREMQALSSKTLFLLMLALAATLFAPAFIYATITLLIGLHVGQYFFATIIFIFLIGILAATASVYLRAVMQRGKSFALPRINISVPKKFYAILVWHSLYKGKLKITVVKFFSLTLLFIPLVWNGGRFPLSDFILFFQVCIATNAVVVFDYVQFLEKDFSSLRNMPVPVYRVFLLFLLVYPLLILPEILILAYYAPSVLGIGFLSPFIYFLGQLLLFTSIAYEKQMKVESYLGVVALIAVALLFIAPLASFWTVGLVLSAIGFIMFCALYYKYEVGL
jgi:hypothetical protein